jgi:hypothetical protein
VAKCQAVFLNYIPHFPEFSDMHLPGKYVAGDCAHPIASLIAVVISQQTTILFYDRKPTRSNARDKHSSSSARKAGPSS